ncbi:MAG: TMEM165/GDT1 family protein [Dehalococcoidia bacterium]
MSSFLLSAFLIFVAELGDKSQLVALWFSTRYRWWTVIAGVATATLVVHLGSVGAGRALDGLVAEVWLRLAVGASFLGFAWWSLRGDVMDESDTRRRGLPLLGTFGVVAAAFFLSEIGDKTQLATVSLAGRDAGWTGVWLGSTVGMVLADALAIGVGLVLGKQLPPRRVAQAAAVLFVAFGLVTMASALL